MLIQWSPGVSGLLSFRESQMVLALSLMVLKFACFRGGVRPFPLFKIRGFEEHCSEKVRGK